MAIGQKLAASLSVSSVFEESGSCLVKIPWASWS